MARIRSIHPALCEDETLAQLPAEVERTFIRLWPHLDDDGRCEDRPKLLKARLYPEHDSITAADVHNDLEVLKSYGLVIRYEVGGKKYLTAKPEAWAKYQRPQKKKESSLPPPPHLSDTATRPLRDEDGTGKARSSLGEGEGVVVGEGVGVTPKPTRAINIERSGWKPTEALIEWAASEYPDIDIVVETQKFLDHFTANGKPMKNWDAAWRNWMRRSQDFTMSRGVKR